MPGTPQTSDLKKLSHGYVSSNRSLAHPDDPLLHPEIEDHAVEVARAAAAEAARLWGLHRVALAATARAEAEVAACAAALAADRGVGPYVAELDALVRADYAPLAPLMNPTEIVRATHPAQLALEALEAGVLAAEEAARAARACAENAQGHANLVYVPAAERHAAATKMQCVVRGKRGRSRAANILAIMQGPRMRAEQRICELILAQRAWTIEKRQWTMQRAQATLVCAAVAVAFHKRRQVFHDWFVKARGAAKKKSKASRAATLHGNERKAANLFIGGIRKKQQRVHEEGAAFRIQKCIRKWVANQQMKRRQKDRERRAGTMFLEAYRRKKFRIEKLRRQVEELRPKGWSTRLRRVHAPSAVPGAEWTVSTVAPWRRVLRARDRGSPRIEAPAGVVVEDALLSPRGSPRALAALGALGDAVAAEFSDAGDALATLRRAKLAARGGVALARPVALCTGALVDLRDPLFVRECVDRSFARGDAERAAQQRRDLWIVDAVAPGADEAMRVGAAVRLVDALLLEHLRRGGIVSQLDVHAEPGSACDLALKHRGFERTGDGLVPGDPRCAVDHASDPLARRDIFEQGRAREHHALSHAVASLIYARANRAAAHAAHAPGGDEAQRVCTERVLHALSKAPAEPVHVHRTLAERREVRKALADLIAAVEAELDADGDGYAGGPSSPASPEPTPRSANAAATLAPLDEPPARRELRKRRMRRFAVLRGLMTFDAVGRLRSPRGSPRPGEGADLLETAEDHALKMQQKVGTIFEKGGAEKRQRAEFKGSGMGTKRQEALTVGLFKEGW